MQARLRAQLGDRSKYSGERRRRSVVEATIVLTITDPLRGSYPLWCNLQAALICSCGASFACMELTTISRFQRLKPIQVFHHICYFLTFSVLSLSSGRERWFTLSSFSSSLAFTPEGEPPLPLKLRTKNPAMRGKMNFCLTRAVWLQTQRANRKPWL